MKQVLKSCMTIDVEDYFQVNAFAANIRWNQQDSRFCT